MKNPVQLALLGGPRAFDQPLHVGRPNLGNRSALLARIEGMLDRRWLSNDGPLVQEFERRVAEISGVGHCVAMCNATIALEIAARALGMRGEVIVPAYSFVATAHALRWQEITPVFADMDPRTHNLDPASVERVATARTSGLVATHLWGRPCDTDALDALARRRGWAVMYDAAHAFGCSRRGRMVGGFGDCEVFSFHATKFINSFEGGAVATNSGPLAEKLRLMRNFGFAGYDRVVHPGINGKMTEVCAAMGLTSLEAMDDIIAANRRNHATYRRGLAGLPGVTLLEWDEGEGERRNFQYVVAEIDPGVAALNRDELVAVLHAENVLARKYFWPGCHRMEPYASEDPDAAIRLPAVERIARNVIVLPTGSAIAHRDVTLVCLTIQSALTNSTAVRLALRRMALNCGNARLDEDSVTE